MHKFNGLFSGKNASNNTTELDDQRAQDKEAAQFDKGSNDDADKPSENAQTGVKKIEAVTLTWDNRSSLH